MATIKSYSDLEQSRKLAEILPLESADMQWIIDDLGEPFPFPVNDKVNENEEPCWSLAALLHVIPDYTLQTNRDGTVFVVCESKKSMVSDAYDNPVDACVAIIEKLHELKML